MHPQHVMKQSKCIEIMYTELFNVKSFKYHKLREKS